MDSDVVFIYDIFMFKFVIVLLLQRIKVLVPVLHHVLHLNFYVTQLKKKKNLLNLLPNYDIIIQSMN